MIGNLHSINIQEHNQTNAYATNMNNPPHNYTLDIPDLLYPTYTRPCSSSHKYVLYIYSGVSNYRRRILLRRTWASYNVMSDNHAKLIFILGTTNDTFKRQKVNNEAAVFKDIVQGDFTDSYNNLSLKGLFGLKWISQYCPDTLFSVKTDDDVFVNTYELFAMLDGLGDYTRTVIGCMFEEKYRKILRHPPECVRYCVGDSVFPGKISFDFLKTH